jgi:hypothetical protein
MWNGGDVVTSPTGNVSFKTLYLISSVRSAVEVAAGVALSVIVKVNLVFGQAVVALPLIVPVAASSARPAGNVGVTDHFSGGSRPERGRRLYLVPLRQSQDLAVGEMADQVVRERQRLRFDNGCNSQFLLDYCTNDQVRTMHEVRALRRAHSWQEFSSAGNVPRFETPIGHLA